MTLVLKKVQCNIYEEKNDFEMVLQRAAVVCCFTSTFVCFSFFYSVHLTILNNILQRDSVMHFLFCIVSTVEKLSRISKLNVI